jgi:hypothetical protein
MQPGSAFQNDLYSNMPNASMAFTMWSTTFGNMNMIITPPAPMIPGKPDQVQAGFPALPYQGIEALLYTQQASNPVVPANQVLTGQTTGAQNVSGQQTMKDNQGNTIYQAGYSQAGF